MSENKQQNGNHWMNDDGNWMKASESKGLDIIISTPVQPIQAPTMDAGPSAPAPDYKD